jgi:hypothetical protein
LSLLAMTAWSDERTSVSVGSASAPVTPNAASEGPVATMATVLLVEPPITKPPMSALLPFRTCMRAEMFARRAPVAAAAAGVHRLTTVGLFCAVLVSVSAPMSGPACAGS